MQSLSLIPTQHCRRLQGVVFDVDDTLTRHGKLEAEAFQALWDLHRAGLTLIAVTGRPLGFAELMARLWPIDLAVGENGAGWIRLIPSELVTDYWDEAAERANQAARLRALAAEALDRFPWACLTDDDWARRCDIAFDIGERQRVTPEACAELRALIESRGARVFQSSVHLHAALGSYDKARGTARASELALGHEIDSDRERWLFVGDSANDAEAFAYFPVSVGVANIVDHLDQLPVPPAYVTRADRGRGFAELAQHLLACRDGCR